MRKANIITLSIVLLSFVIGAYFYPQLPDQIASHWNARGEVDDYLSKTWGLFLIPLMLSGFFLMFLVIPKIDPLKENIKKFIKYFDLLILFLFSFLFYVYLLMILWNLGLRFDMSYLIIPPVGLLFIFIGFIFEKTKRNWFIGIRTPWTLSSDSVWEKTHKLGAKLFKVSGLVILAGIFFEKYLLFFIIIPAVFTAIYTMVYSYFEYQKEQKKS